MSLSRVRQRDAVENEKTRMIRTTDERHGERSGEKRAEESKGEEGKRKQKIKKALVKKNTGSYRKRGIIDPNWMICGDGCLPQGSKSLCIINIMTVIHTLFLQLSPERAQ